MSLSPADLALLTRCVDLAEEALDAGDEPFGSLLADADGGIVRTDRNRVGSGDPTRHPEFELARWAASNLTPEQRRTTSMYTSNEHCPMCSAAHGWVGLGRLVYAASSAQLSAWLGEWGVGPAPINTLPAEAVVPGLEVAGPAPELTARVKDLQARARGVR